MAVARAVEDGGRVAARAAGNEGARAVARVAARAAAREAAISGGEQLQSDEPRHLRSNWTDALLPIRCRHAK